ncbi:uncharacterized protein DEA37_0004433, partial [Paragonimus westermani]
LSSSEASNGFSPSAVQYLHHSSTSPSSDNDSSSSNLRQQCHSNKPSGHSTFRRTRRQQERARQTGLMNSPAATDYHLAYTSVANASELTDLITAQSSQCDRNSGSSVVAGTSSIDVEDYNQVCTTFKPPVPAHMISSPCSKSGPDFGSSVTSCSMHDAKPNNQIPDNVEVYYTGLTEPSLNRDPFSAGVNCDALSNSGGFLNQSTSGCPSLPTTVSSGTEFYFLSSDHGFNQSNINRVEGSLKSNYDFSHLELDLSTSFRDLYHKLFDSQGVGFTMKSSVAALSQTCVPNLASREICFVNDKNQPISTIASLDTVHVTGNSGHQMNGDGLLTLGRLLFGPPHTTDSNEHYFKNNLDALSHNPSSVETSDLSQAVQNVSSFSCLLQRSLQVASQFDWNTVNLEDFSDLTTKMRAASNVNVNELTIEQLQELNTSLENAFDRIAIESSFDRLGDFSPQVPSANGCQDQSLNRGLHLHQRQSLRVAYDEQIVLSHHADSSVTHSAPLNGTRGPGDHDLVSYASLSSSAVTPPTRTALDMTSLVDSSTASQMSTLSVGGNYLKTSENFVTMAIHSPVRSNISVLWDLVNAVDTTAAYSDQCSLSNSSLTLSGQPCELPLKDMESRRFSSARDNSKMCMPDFPIWMQNQTERNPLSSYFAPVPTENYVSRVVDSRSSPLGLDSTQLKITTSALSQHIPDPDTFNQSSLPPGLLNVLPVGPENDVTRHSTNYRPTTGTCPLTAREIGASVSTDFSVMNSSCSDASHPLRFFTSGRDDNHHTIEHVTSSYPPLVSVTLSPHSNSHNFFAIKSAVSTEFSHNSNSFSCHQATTFDANHTGQGPDEFNWDSIV